MGEVPERLIGALLDVGQDVGRSLDLRKGAIARVVEQRDARDQQAVQAHRFGRFARE